MPPISLTHHLAGCHPFQNHFRLKKKIHFFYISVINDDYISVVATSLFDNDVQQAVLNEMSDDNDDNDNEAVSDDNDDQHSSS